MLGPEVFGLDYLALVGWEDGSRFRDDIEGAEVELGGCVLDQPLQLVGGAPGVEPVGDVSLLRKTGELNDTNDPRDTLKASGHIQGMSVTGPVVVR